MGIRVTRENLVPLLDLGVFFIFGTISFIASPFFLLQSYSHVAIGNYAHPHVLAAVHTLLLGWGTAVALGALQQLIPVLFSTELYSPRLARAAAVIYAVGASCFIAGFWYFRTTLFIIGVLAVVTAVGMVGINVWRSQKHTFTRSARIVRPFVRSAYVYLMLTVVAGAGLALHLFTGILQEVRHPLFIAHVAFGLAGWFVMLVLGISYHMLPFFGLTPKKQEFQAVPYVRYVLHFGIVTVWIASWHKSLNVFFFVGLFLLSLALWLFLWDIRLLFGKPRRKRKVNPTVVHVRLGHMYLAVLALFLLICLFQPLTNKTVMFVGVLGLYGWLSNTVLGYFYRIFPFYVWHNKYWGRARERSVPSFRHMVTLMPAWIGGAMYNIGIIGVLIAFFRNNAMYVALLSMAVGVLICGINLLRTAFR